MSHSRYYTGGTSMIPDWTRERKRMVDERDLGGPGQ